MKKTSEKLENVYIFDNVSYFSSILPRTESTPSLTPHNFRLIILDKGSFSVYDFDWFEKDGSNRNFRYNNGCIDKDFVPIEVRSLLDTILCIKFATQHLADAQAMLDCVDKADAKKFFAELFSAFNEKTDSKEKLNLALQGLNIAAMAFCNIDEEIFDEFSNASDVISEVLSEI